MPKTLTLRERQVARLVADGLKAREVAEELGISVQSVKNHKHMIYVKLGARNAVEMAKVLKL